MSGHNGHKLKALKNRLTKRQIELRNVHRQKGGTWRKDMVDNLNAMFQKTATVVNKNQDLNDRRQKHMSIAFGVLTLAVLFLIGRTLGWW